MLAECTTLARLHKLLARDSKKMSGERMAFNSFNCWSITPFINDLVALLFMSIRHPPPMPFLVGVIGRGMF
jgi:hypothetical protein